MSRAKKRSTGLNYAAHIARAEPLELAVNQTLPTLAHAVDRHALIERTAGDGAYGRVHAGGITATRKDRDLFH